jgi:hypothetical protein
MRQQNEARSEWELAGQEPENDWLTAAVDLDDAPETQTVLNATGLTRPIPGLTPPAEKERLDSFIADDADSLWLVGAHGGAGSSTLGAAYGLPALTRRWPISREGTHVVLVCRANLSGLETARSAAREWASNDLPNVQVHGLIIVADAPGRAPKPLQQLATHVAGTVPRVWHVDWIEQLRTSPATPELATGPLKSLTPQIQLLREQISNQRSTQ